MEEAKRRSRRSHDRELKRRVLAQCAQAGASVAQVAMAHGLNANLVHKWRRAARASDRVGATAFIPVTVEGMVSAPAQPIELELQRGAISVRVRWPMEGAPECAAWLRGVLR